MRHLHAALMAGVLLLAGAGCICSSSAYRSGS
jgi:hypothetical protein